MAIRHPILLLVAASGLAGCVAYPAPVAYAPARGPVAVYDAPPPAVVYVAPRPRRYWVPGRCDAWGRCWGGHWR